MPLVVVETDPRGSNLNVQFAAPQVDVESHGAVTQSQREIILAIALSVTQFFPPNNKEKERKLEKKKIIQVAPYLLLVGR